MVFVVRTVWLFPRTRWSPKDTSQTNAALNINRNAALSPGNVRNVVLVSIDTCRADHLSCYGYSRKTTPNIDALAADSVMFNHAVSHVPITLPSHCSMLTGTTPLYHRVRDNTSYRLAESNVTLAEILHENGFVTAAIIGAFILDSQFGLDQGFDTYNDDIRKGKDKKWGFISERRAEEVTRLANAWLERNHKDRFFLFVHYFDPHAEYELHERFEFRSLPQISLRRDKYDSEIAYTDYWLGQLIVKLKKMNIYDSTLLIVTADHGESLGQHGELSHTYCIYHSTLHVPLIIKAPGWPKGATIHNTVGLIDIMPTVCGFLGIAVPEHIKGKDLNVFFTDQDDPAKQRYYYCESLIPTKFDLSPFLGLVSDNWKYIHTLDPALYDLRKDPRETRNLINQQPKRTSIMQENLRLILQNSHIANTNTIGSRTILDEETLRRLRSLGYVSDRTVDENIAFVPEKLDPMKFIGIHNFAEKIVALIMGKKFKKAKKLCKKVLAKWPNTKVAHYYLGQVAVFEEDMPLAITSFSRYLQGMDADSKGFDMRIKPSYELGRCHELLAVAFKHEGQMEKAIKHHKKAEEIRLLLGLPTKSKEH